jgi:hypothetical protein
MMTFNGVKNTIFLLEQQCRTQVVIEESKRGRWNRNACMTPPGMLLSDSLEPDLSYTSILYCLDDICMSTLINDVKRTLVNTRSFLSVCVFLGF